LPDRGAGRAIPLRRRRCFSAQAGLWPLQWVL